MQNEFANDSMTHLSVGWKSIARIAAERPSKLFGITADDDLLMSSPISKI